MVSKQGSDITRCVCLNEAGGVGATRMWEGEGWERLQCPGGRYWPLRPGWGGPGQRGGVRQRGATAGLGHGSGGEADREVEMEGAGHIPRFLACPAGGMVEPVPGTGKTLEEDRCGEGHESSLGLRTVPQQTSSGCRGGAGAESFEGQSRLLLVTDAVRVDGDIREGGLGKEGWPRGLCPYWPRSREWAAWPEVGGR